MEAVLYIQNILSPRREYILYILPPFLVTGFQAFQLVGAFQAMLHCLATNSVQLPASAYNATT